MRQRLVDILGGEVGMLSYDLVDWETFFPSIDHIVTGRGTCEKVLTFDTWPYGGKRVIVLSTTLATDDARIIVVRSVEEARRELAESAAGQVYVDGGKVIQAFPCVPYRPR